MTYADADAENKMLIAVAKADKDRDAGNGKLVKIVAKNSGILDEALVTLDMAEGRIVQKVDKVVDNLIRHTASLKEHLERYRCVDNQSMHLLPAAVSHHRYEHHLRREGPYRRPKDEEVSKIRRQYRSPVLDGLRVGSTPGSATARTSENVFNYDGKLEGLEAQWTDLDAKVRVERAKLRKKDGGGDEEADSVVTACCR